ncbi:MAG: GIY-YIG nuclease family protein [Patescibacteria group bacterium]
MNAPSLKGIYQIKNVLTGECYIGSSFNIQRRLADHMRYLSDGVHINKMLQGSWKKYGSENFTISILEIVGDDLALAEREIFWVKKTRAEKDGFNTKTDQHKYSSVIVVNLTTKFELESLGMGSMQSTLSQLLKFYQKQHGSKPTTERL